MGTSTNPILFILPTTEKTFVPELFLQPMLENHFAPLLIMAGTFAHVSTLFRLEGLSHSPCSTVCMYFALGSPALPSREVIRAVDSPQTNAPAPLPIFRSKSNPVFRIFFPRKPYSLAWLIARCRFATAKGYSFLTYINPWPEPMAKAPIII